MATMPALVGMNWQQATAVLIRASITPDNGLVPGTVYPAVGYFDKWPVAIVWVVGASGVKPCEVTAQLPVAGVTLAFNAPITLTLENYPLGISNLYSAGGYS